MEYYPEQYNLTNVDWPAHDIADDLPTQIEVNATDKFRNTEELMAILEDNYGYRPLSFRRITTRLEGAHDMFNIYRFSSAA